MDNNSNKICKACGEANKMFFQGKTTCSACYSKISNAKYKGYFSSYYQLNKDKLKARAKELYDEKTKDAIKKPSGRPKKNQVVKEPRPRGRPRKDKEIIV